MPLMNYKDVLLDATRIPAAIEKRIPFKVPSIATFLAKTATKLPNLRNFPFGLPALPRISMPGGAVKQPGPGGAATPSYVSGVEVVPVSSPVRSSSGGIIPLLFE